MSSDKRRIDVMVSSTSTDLKAHRLRVADVITRLRMTPRNMDNDAPTGEDGLTYSLRLVDEADVYVLLLGFFYGVIPDDPRNPERLSFTELEYRRALEREKLGELLVLPFVMAEEHLLTQAQVESDPEKHARLQEFRKLALSKQTRLFKSIDELETWAMQALTQSHYIRNLQNADKAAEGSDTRAFRPQSGTTFAKYTLDELIDEGGNGQVWRGRELLPDGHYQRVAIKLLKPEISADARRVERFKKEISAARRLNHPNILRALDFGLHQEQFYVVMDFIEGRTLRHQLHGRALPTELAIGWLSQIAAALQEAHEHGLIHRDVKPENILYRRKGDTDVLYLTDFGLVYSSDPEGAVTDEGDLVGTGRYMAPEQCNPQVGEVTPRSDVYALAIIAYELLTGGLPFTGPNKVVLCQEHLHTPLPQHPALPPSLYRVLAKAAAKRPDERYDSSAAFLADLRRWQEDPANLAPIINAYIETLEKRLRDRVLDQFVELSGDERTLRSHVETALNEAFDPMAGFVDYDEFFRVICAPVEADQVRTHGGETAREYVPNVHERLMALDRVVLVGEPGAGKTWMLLRTALAYASQYRAGTAKARIPVLIPLNQYKGQQPFPEFVRSRAGALGTHLERLAREGRLVLLCDALNEMPQRHLDEVRSLLRTSDRFVVSCRIRDYREQLNVLGMPPLEQVILRDMDLDAIREFIRRRLKGSLAESLWIALGGSEELWTLWQTLQRQGRAERFWQPEELEWNEKGITWQQRHAHQNMHTQGARLLLLARNPFTAQMICGIYESEGVLQPNRAALFGRFAASLIEREKRNAERQGLVFPEADAVEGALVAIARALQAAKATVLSEAEALEAITSGTRVEPTEAELLLKSALDANLLNADGAGLKFAHQLLQEYFAVRILLQAMEPSDSPTFGQNAVQFFREGAGWWDAGVWRETTVILGEFLAGEGRMNDAVRWLAPSSPEVALHVITRSAAGLTLDSLDAATRKALITGARAKTTETKPVGRAAAYRVLGLLNADDRPGVGVRELPSPSGEGPGVRVPDIDWVLIPGDGEWVYQEDKHPPLPAFSVSRYPITYAQFEAFATASDFNGDRWWAGMPEEQEAYGTTYRTRELSEQAFRYANHPREMVSWYQAVAFCKWLSDKLGYEVTLPTEQQWEKAARGTDGREYPYEGAFDAAKGNTRETGILQTSAVGIFPDGRSPYEVHDLSGNVWEWCLNKVDEPEQIDVDKSGDSRVLRGGSWYNDRDFARAVDRDDSRPASRYDFIGFRVVAAFVPSQKL